MATLFPVLGEGAGYSVLLAGNANIHSAFIIFATSSDSGDSPARGDAVNLDQTSTYLLLNYLPINTDGASAPVVFNAGLEDPTVVFHAYQNGARVAGSEPVTIPLGTVSSVVDHLTDKRSAERKRDCQVDEKSGAAAPMVSRNGAGPELSQYLADNND